jgi:hypothetical protein
MVPYDVPRSPRGVWEFAEGRKSFPQEDPGVLGTPREGNPWSDCDRRGLWPDRLAILGAFGPIA